MITKHIFALASFPKAVLFFLATSLGALGFVFIMQFFLGYDPCILCIWQRVPYATVGFLSALALFWKPYGQQSKFILGLIAVVFILGATLALFHTGVERHWWLGTSGCAIQPSHATDTQSLREELLSTAVAHCDVISWSLFGLSMANYNIPFSLLMAGFAGFALYRNRSLK
jgi:disulfide bond formation protein DsbB